MSDSCVEDKNKCWWRLKPNYYLISLKNPKGSMHHAEGAIYKGSSLIMTSGTIVYLLDESGNWNRFFTSFKIMERFGDYIHEEIEDEEAEDFINRVKLKTI